MHAYSETERYSQSACWAIHIYEFVNGMLPLPLLSIYECQSDTHEYNTRQSTGPRHMKAHTDLMHRSFLCKGPILWSELDGNIKSSKTKTNFKIRATRRIMEDYWFFSHIDEDWEILWEIVLLCHRWMNEQYLLFCIYFYVGCHCLRLKVTDNPCFPEIHNHELFMSKPWTIHGINLFAEPWTIHELFMSNSWSKILLSWNS